MAEREDLVAIGRMLDIDDAKPEGHDGRMDIGLLRTIVTTLKSMSNPEELHRGSKSKNRTILAAHLIDGRIPDSLAFPKKVRSGSNLTEDSQLWMDLKKLNDLFKSDYSCRRQMLINRLDCTVESFKWKASEERKQAHLVAQGDKKSRSDKTSLNDMIHEKYDQARIGLTKEPQVTISHLLALRETECDELLNSVVSSKNVDCQVVYKPTKLQRQNNTGQLVNLKQIIIPEVPDRGGRACELRPPSKETFSQQRRGRSGGKRF